MCVSRVGSMHHRKLQLLDSTTGGCGTASPGLMLNMNSLQKLPELDKSLSTSDTLVSSPFRRPSQMLVGWCVCVCACLCLCLCIVSDSMRLAYTISSYVLYQQSGFWILFLKFEIFSFLWKLFYFMLITLLFYEFIISY